MCCLVGDWSGARHRAVGLGLLYPTLFLHHRAIEGSAADLPLLTAGRDANACGFAVKAKFATLSTGAGRIIMRRGTE